MNHININHAKRYRFLFEEETGHIISVQIVNTHGWSFRHKGVTRSKHWPGIVYVDITSDNDNKAISEALKAMKKFKENNKK